VELCPSGFSKDGAGAIIAMLPLKAPIDTANTQWHNRSATTFLHYFVAICSAPNEWQTFMSVKGTAKEE
jgi:hypothetical protein